MRAATPVAGMPSAKVKGTGAKCGAGRALSSLSLGMPVFIPRDGTSSSCPPDPVVQDLRVALSLQHTVLEMPQSWEGAQKHPEMEHSLTWPLGGTQPWSISPTASVLNPILAGQSPSSPPQCSTPQIHPCPMEPAPNPTVLILNLRDPSLLHRAHLQLLHPPKNLSGNTHPCRAVLGRACLDDLLEEPPLPPAPRPARHHAQVDYSQSSEAGQASSAGPALQVTHSPGGC